MKTAVLAVLLTLGASANPGGAPTGLRGKVAESLDAGEYTYVRITTESGDRWAAVPKNTFKPGDKIAVDGSILMENYRSKRLGKNFDRVLFGVLSKPAASGPVSKAEGPQARSVAELFAEKAALAGKPVTVRGRVVKYNKNILGTNWVHLRDGSGSRERQNDDVAVTTTDGAKLGEVVTVNGTVAVDRDFGAGYAYPILIEKARITGR